MIIRFKNWLSGYSMRSKLFISFAATVIGVLFLVMILLNYFISNRYKERILHSASQSYEQAYSFLQNYIDNMIYASDQIFYNGDIQRVLSSSGFSGNRDYAVQYREFLTLNHVFSSIELNEIIFGARIFIPDEIKYSNNVVHFVKRSVLESRADYNEFLAYTASEKVFFTMPEIVDVPGRPQPVSVVSLLRTIRAVDGTATPIGVEQISILTSQIQNVIEKSDITATGLVYLMNQSGGVISASENGRELLDSLQANSALPKYGDVENWKSRELAGSGYMVNQKLLINADWALVAIIPAKEIEEQSRQIGLIIVSLTIVAVIAVFAVSYLISRYYTKRLNLLADMMGSLQNGNLDVQFRDLGNDEIGELFRTFEYMTARIESLMKEQYESGKAVKSAQFQALQAQINPHFLYNTLDLINWEAIDHHAPEIAQIAQSLARFYRISLNKGRQIVTIAEELSHVKAYVNIENRHFNNSITLNIDVPDEIMELACINIILQPFVENSIMHNLAKDIAIQECNITISARLQGKDIVCTVVDDGVGMTENQIEQIFIKNTANRSHGYGVKNINSRIKLCYGEEYGLTYYSGFGHGVIVEILIPALTPAEAESRIE